VTAGNLADNAAVRPPLARADGFAPIGDYGAVGDGRATALIARDGAVDWLCLPAHDSGSVFGALLDPQRGGRFEVVPSGSVTGSRQRYLPQTNVLETEIEATDGTLRITDAASTDGGRQLPWWELVRRIECVSGSAEVRWRFAPRFGYATTPTSLRTIDEHVVVADSEAGQLALLHWNAGPATVTPEEAAGAQRLQQGDAATMALVHSVDAPLPLPRRDELEDRLERTIRGWREWLAAHDYEGPWRDAVERSILALRLLTTPSGAIAAAATTSLPEKVGGERNFDYRHAWPRDSALALASLLHTGLREPAHTSLAWLLHALERTHPRVQPIYRLEGGTLDHQIELELRGYRGSKPVREGNDAAGQLQLGAYGDLMHTAWLYVRQGNLLDPGTGLRLAENADVVCEIWRNEDAGIWELHTNRHYTASKMGCWLALQYALDLCEEGQVPDTHADRWAKERDAIGAFIEERCWSEERQSYLQHPDDDVLDAATLLMLGKGYAQRAGEGRSKATLTALREELEDGAAVYRYSGMSSSEGAFIACTFWVCEALAREGSHEDAAELFERALTIRNRLGLLSEEFDPATGELLGNYPQALSHLALINAAAEIKA
jgi:GH15 family glucan-1,4-alpha-glucosidase